MCGICGYISKRFIDRDTLGAMNDLMYYRGPDDAGVEVTDLPDGRHLGMAQRRLAIQDLSPNGHQPMHSADDRFVIVYNGEIYNFADLRKELPPYPYRSTCDTEVILAAFLNRGIDCVSWFNGMFAFALWDRQEESLWLVRDRLGQKPLYYYLENEDDESSRGLFFASDLKVIMHAPGFEKQIRHDVLGRYLCQGYINAPDTIFRHVYKLEPGTVLCFRRGKITKSTYWDVSAVYSRMQEHPVTDYGEAKQTLKGLLQQATARRLVADVPVGCFLSGGYDSSLVTALAQEKLGSTPLKTFSIGFEDPEYNEAGFAKEVAEHLGTDHTEVYISGEDMFDLVDSIPEYFDEPFADSSQIPTMLVSKTAREKVTVALSGDAGDELFCGYNVYDRIAQAQRLDKLGAIAHVIGQIPVGSGKLEDRYPFRIRTISRNRNRDTKAQFGEGSYGETAREISGWKEGDLPLSYPTERSYDTGSWQVRRMLLDMDTYLPGDILNKVDRASMKYSLENRCPLLDVNVVEYSYQIDHRFKYHGGTKKYILKDIAYDYIPKSILDRPKKGFAVPLDRWLRGPLREKLCTCADPAYLKRQGLFDPAATDRLIRSFLDRGDAGHGTGRNYSKIVWSFFVFQQWYEAYM